MDDKSTTTPMDVTVTLIPRRRKKDTALKIEMARAERAKDPDYHVTVRLSNIASGRFVLPGTLSLEEAHAQAKARIKGMHQFSVNTHENETYWYDKDGAVTSVGYGDRPSISITRQDIPVDQNCGDRNNKPKV
jgi:hypothetical protein